jgi:hypothetical protein
VEFVGVGEQVPARAGLLAQRVAQGGVGVFVPRPAADRGRGDPEQAGGVLELVALLGVDVVREVEGEQEPFDAHSAVVGGPDGQ